MFKLELARRLANLTPPGVRNPDDPHFWQERVLFVILLVIAIGAPLTILGSLSIILAHKAWLVLGLDLTVYCLSMAMLLRPRLSYRLRAFCCCLAVFTVAIALVTEIGPRFPMPAWLFTFAIFAGLLLGRKAALIAVFLNLITLLLAGLAIQHELWPPPVISAIKVTDWPQSVLNFIFLNLIASLGVSQVLRGVLVSHKEIRRQAAELQAVRDRQKNILDSIAAGIFLVDRKSHLVDYANSAALEMIEGSINQVVGKDSRLFIEDSLDELELNEIAAGEAEPTEKFLITNANNKLPVMSKVFPVFMNDREFFLETFLDISQRKKLEEQLNHAQKMEAVGTLAGGIAHEFNNLLHAIMGYSELVGMSLSKGHPAKQDLSQISNTVTKAKTLVQQILTFSRKANVPKKPLDLNIMVKEALEILERTVPKMIRLEFHSQENLNTVSADHQQMEQIILNLVSNAADAMPEGGIVEVATENLTVENRTCDVCGDVFSGNFVLITVKDNGTGICEKNRAKIFNPFFTTKDVGKGTGLGLSTVLGIVTDHGGHIECKSQENIGTIFRIYLPVDGSIIQPIVSESKVIEDNPSGTETILLVDDEETIRAFASKALGQFGYTVLTASNGEDALSTYSELRNSIDLVILDISMPGMGGYKCLQELLKVNPAVRVFISSGYSENDQVGDCLDAGAVGFMGKPYGLSDLLTKVRNILDDNEMV